MSVPVIDRTMQYVSKTQSLPIWSIVCFGLSIAQLVLYYLRHKFANDVCWMRMMINKERVNQLRLHNMAIAVIHQCNQQKDERADFVAISISFFIVV